MTEGSKDPGHIADALDDLKNGMAQEARQNREILERIEEHLGSIATSLRALAQLN